MRVARRWIAAVVVVYGLFLVLVGVATGPANVWMTIAVILIGIGIAAFGARLAWRSVRIRATANRPDELSQPPIDG
jgi:hypothetical protein